MIKYLENALGNDQFFKLMNEPNHLEAKKLFVQLNKFNMEKVINLYEHSNSLESLAYVKLNLYLSNNNVSILEDSKDHFSKSNLKFEEDVIKRLLNKDHWRSN
jgi:hypothetical protein